MCKMPLGDKGSALFLYLEIFSFVLFVLSSGLAFNARYKDRPMFVAAAVIFALLSSYFVIEEASKRVGHFFTKGSKPLARGGSIFTQQELEDLAAQAGAHVCFAGCTLAQHTLLRVPSLEDVEGDKRTFLITKNNAVSCRSSAGCPSAVVIWDDDKMYLVKEGFISDRQASLIARQAFTQDR
jgi:hypothetical protein